MSGSANTGWQKEWGEVGMIMAMGPQRTHQRTLKEKHIRLFQSGDRWTDPDVKGGWISHFRIWWPAAHFLWWENLKYG